MFTLSIEDTVKFLKSEFFLSPEKAQKLMEIVSALVQTEGEKGNFTENFKSPIYVKDKIIHVDYKKYDNYDILSKISKYHNKATNSQAFIGILGWSILAPLHYYLKDMSKVIIQPPLILNEGRTGGGKTSIPNLFLGKGFDMNKKIYFLGMQRVRSDSTLNQHLNKTNLPVLIDDVKPSWLTKNSENFKGYVQVGQFADRGKQNGIEMNEFKGLSSIIFTMNDLYPLDSDSALYGRLLVFRFNQSNSLRKNKGDFNNFVKSLPDGFLLSICKEILDEKETTSIYSEIEKFETPENWANCGIKLINSLCNQYNIPEFPEIKTTLNDDYSLAEEVSDMFISEWERLENSVKEIGYDKEAMKMQTYRSRIETQFKVEQNNNRIFIYFTGSAFKVLTAGLKLPYENANDFINNIKSTESIKVENFGIPKSIRISGFPKKCYVISIPNDNNNSKEIYDKPETPGNNQVNSKAIENREKADTAGLPPGAVKDELEQYNADKEWIREHEKELNANDGGKHLETSKYKPEYYQVLKDFDMYNESFFYNSDLICESLRKIPKKGSSETAFVLLKLLIPPGKSTKFPEGWNHFITDQRIVRHLHSESEFNALSRGGAQ